MYPESYDTKRREYTLGNYVVYILVEAEPSCIHLTDQEGNLPLHLAASGDHVDVIRALLDGNANIDSRNVRRWTALDAAAANGAIKAVNMLIKLGCSVENPEDAAVSMSITNFLSYYLFGDQNCCLYQKACTIWLSEIHLIGTNLV
ncbi:unnamed protein product [Protopolystoma xenopodis]|uniref:Uncharacterized protein n=1 Tax=Protopolystoma xenopodis TaxID=117903 RepID=A0A448WHK8_9PLAT|nr:unnamed protein product [Protopolystoma xenopodis]